jgi:F-type H+-transporting ATPase subunit b
MLVASSNFLVPNGTFIAELVAFVIIVGIIAKWILPPLKKAMVAREEEIRRSLDAAADARKAADEGARERQEVLDEARREARTIISQATRVGEKVRSESQEAARLEYERIVSSADVEIQLARQRAIEEVTDLVADLVMEAAERVLRVELDSERHRELISEVISSLSSTSSGRDRPQFEGGARVATPKQ